MKPTEIIITGAGGTGLFSWATNKLYGRMTDSAYNRHAKVYKPAGVVSTIIPAFNEEDYIESTLKSILSQNIILKYSDYFECIVVDNESTDRTAKIAKQYCQVISAPRGLLNARHAGIKHASGDIIVFADADSYYPPNWLNLLIRHFHRPEVVAVTGPFLTQGNLLHKLVEVWRASLFPSPRVLCGANSALIKQAYYKVGGYDFSIDQFNREEVFIESEMVLAAKLKTVGEVIFDIQACCFTSARSVGVGTLKEQRQPLPKYVQEIERGERF